MGTQHLESALTLGVVTATGTDAEAQCTASVAHWMACVTTIEPGEGLRVRLQTTVSQRYTAVSWKLSDLVVAGVGASLLMLRTDDTDAMHGAARASVTCWLASQCRHSKLSSTAVFAA